MPSPEIADARWISSRRARASSRAGTLGN